MKTKLALLTFSCLFGLFNLNRYTSTYPQVNQPDYPIINYQPPPQPHTANYSAPALNAHDYILLDAATNTILLSKNPYQKIFPASITKLATAVTALNVYPLDEIITVDQTYTVGKVMGLKLGEKITVKSLVTALLMHSANDAALALANHHNENLAGFVKQMNLMAQKYRLKDTHFINCDGIHHPSHQSTVYDLAQLARISIKNPIVVDMAKNQKLTVSDIDDTVKHHLESTNKLLGLIPEIEGLKTGWTPKAGGCFVALINIDGHYLISVVAQSQDRFADTSRLITWAKQNITWTTHQP